MFEVFFADCFTASAPLVKVLFIASFASSYAFSVFFTAVSVAFQAHPSWIQTLTNRNCHLVICVWTSLLSPQDTLRNIASRLRFDTTRPGTGCIQIGLRGCMVPAAHAGIHLHSACRSNAQLDTLGTYRSLVNSRPGCTFLPFSTQPGQFLALLLFRNTASS